MIKPETFEELRLLVWLEQQGCLKGEGYARAAALLEDAEVAQAWDEIDEALWRLRRPPQVERRPS